jgi:FkbM family methyltransferase
MQNAATRLIGKVLNVVDPGNYVRGFRDYYFRNAWLGRAKNIVHVGANTGQEAEMYASRGLGVLWIEPIPAIFNALENHIRQFPNQRACQALVSAESGKAVTLHVASNGGQSSSIFEMGNGLKETWPGIDYVDRIDLLTRTLDEILLGDARHYDGLVMDTQGSELLILQGALSALAGFRYIKTEAADFELYKGAATEMELMSFLKPRGYRLLRRDVFARTPDGTGECSDMIFERAAP